MKFLIFFLAVILVWTGCPNPAVETPASVSLGGTSQERVAFSAIRATDNKAYTVEAFLLAENDSCLVYADCNTGVAQSTGEKIAREYEEHIAPDIAASFGNYYPSRKIAILLLDIIDEYKAGGANSSTYIAGYFSMTDILPKSSMPDSNEMPMLYIDINPGNPGSDEFYTTIAHELQHLINFSSRYERKNPGLDSITTQSALNTLIESIRQDEWIDEGLSSAAEYIYNKAAGNNSAGKWHIKDKIDYYNNAQTYYRRGQSGIANGNNFFTWGENSNFIYDEYVTVYLFFQWLRIQADNSTNNTTSGESIYRSIIESEYGDYRAVTYAARKHIPRLFEGTESTDDQAWEWERLLETWFAANYVNAPEKEAVDGLFGYNGEFTLSPAALNGGRTGAVSLYPGEGVYSGLGGKTFSYPQNSQAHIRYAGLDKTEDPVTRITGGGSGDGDTLLTFNANSNAAGRAERGVLADVDLEPVSAEPSATGRAAGLSAGPFPIDIRPPLRFE